MDVLLSKAEECQQESHHQLQGMTIDHADLLWGPVLPEVEAQEEGWKLTHQKVDLQKWSKKN